MVNTRLTSTGRNAQTISKQRNNISNHDIMLLYTCRRASGRDLGTVPVGGGDTGGPGAAGRGDGH